MVKTKRTIKHKKNTKSNNLEDQSLLLLPPLITSPLPDSPLPDSPLPDSHLPDSPLPNSPLSESKEDTNESKKDKIQQLIIELETLQNEFNATKTKKRPRQDEDDPLKLTWHILYYNICKSIPNLEKRLTDNPQMKNAQHIQEYLDMTYDLAKRIIEFRKTKNDVFITELDRDYESRLDKAKKRNRNQNKTN